MHCFVGLQGYLIDKKVFFGGWELLFWGYWLFLSGGWFGWGEYIKMVS
jgi:hypothetical protein